MTYENACRWYQFDPFAHRPKERCNVGALIAESDGHDVSLRSYDQGRFERSIGVDLGEMTRRMKT
jgi:hypothetical protein